MKKLMYLIVLVLILGLVLNGCLLSNVGQVPATPQSGIAYLTKNGLPPNLVGLWHFDEGVGTTASDSSGNGNDGTITGATYVGSTNAMFGDAMSFDGTDGYVSMAQSDFLDMTSAYTLEAWVNVTDDLLPNKYRPILFRGTTNANDIEVYVQAVSKDLIVAHNRGNGGIFDYVGFVDPPLGMPFHLAVTFDGTNVQAYYDGTAAGVSQQTTAMTAPADTDKAWWIGKVDHSAFNYLGSGNLHYFKGTIDEVRIWNGALSGDAIQQSYGLGGATDIDRVVQLRHQVLTSGEVVCFTSAFYLGRQGEDTDRTVDIYIMSASGGRTIEEIGFRVATPAKTNGSMTSSFCSGTQGTALVNNGPVTSKGKTSTSIHLYVELDTTERLGVNAQYLPWD